MYIRKVVFCFISTILLAGCPALEEGKIPNASNILEGQLTTGMTKKKFYAVFRSVVQEPNLINEFNCSEFSCNEDCVGHSIIVGNFDEGKPSWSCGRLEVQIKACFDNNENLLSHKMKRGKHCP